MSIGFHTALLRKQRGMSQGQLAELLSIHQSRVTRWEKDKVQPKLARIFDIKPGDLLSITADGVRNATRSIDDPKLNELLGQLLTRARVQDGIGARP